MATQQQQEPGRANKQKNFSRMLFWGMVIALLVILAVYYVFAFTMQVHHGHGQADPDKQSMVMRQASIAA